MPTTSKKASLKSSTSLQRALDSAQERQSLSKIAVDAKVSTKTLAAVRKGPSATPMSGDGRKRAGLAESLTRLALHLGVSPTEALEQFGLEMSEVNVRSGFDRARRGYSRPQMVADRALSDIELRSLANDDQELTVRVGILDWMPFYGDEGRAAFAESFMDRLVQSVNPFWHPDTIKVGTIHDAINGLIDDEMRKDVDRREAHYDLVFGLYDTSYRRLEGLDFIPIPGLFIELGVVASRKMEWPDVLDPSERRPFAMALKEEAGYHLLRGACGYKGSDVREILHHNEKKIAAELLWRAREYKTRDVVFVADAYTCSNVLRYIRDRDSWLPHWPGDGDPPGDEITKNFQLIESDVSRQKSGDPSWTPLFPVCVAVRADSRRFRELLEAAMRADLFNHGRLPTARLYQQLLESPESRHVHVDISTFEFLGKHHADRFAEAWLDVLMKATNKDRAAAFEKLPVAMQMRHLLDDPKPNRGNPSQTGG